MLKTNERKDKDLLHLLALIFIHLNFTYSRYSFFFKSSMIPFDNIFLP